MTLCNGTDDPPLTFATDPAAALLPPTWNPAHITLTREQGEDVGFYQYTGITDNTTANYAVSFANPADETFEIIEEGTPTLPIAGTVSISIDAISGILTAHAAITNGSGDIYYAWTVDGATPAHDATDPTYEPAASELGKQIAVTITRDGTTGSLTDNVTLYRVNITLSGNQGIDAAGISAPYGKVGDNVEIAYTVANIGSLLNTLIFSGVSTTLLTATSHGDGIRHYAIAAPDANANGVITITATFAHSDTPTPISVLSQTPLDNAAKVVITSGLQIIKTLGNCLVG